MARSRATYLNELSTADLKQLLEARQRIDVLEKERGRLAKELAVVERELADLMVGSKKPTAARKTIPKISTKTKAKTQTKVKAGGKVPPVRLEDVVVTIIKKARKPVAYQDILSRIQKGKLFTSRSSNFDNVLRRTLSTSKKIKRAGRGVYDVT